MSIGDRLREERERLGLTQPSLADLVGATKQTVFRWETGRAFPGGDAFEVMAAAGVDVLYVITGQRGGVALTPKEAALVDNFRHSPEDQQAALLTTSTAFAQPPKRGRAVKKQAA